jgi:hypothetical protein
VQDLALGFDNGVPTPTYTRIGFLNSTQIEVGRTDLAVWANSSNNTFIRIGMTIPIG